MTRDEALTMARAAEVCNFDVKADEQLLTWANMFMLVEAMAIARERSACALVADRYATDPGADTEDRHAGETIAATIRGRITACPVEQRTPQMMKDAAIDQIHFAEEFMAAIHEQEYGEAVKRKARIWDRAIRFPHV